MPYLTYARKKKMSPKWPMGSNGKAPFGWGADRETEVVL